MGYAQEQKVDAGQRFKSASGLIVETTGNTVHIDSHKMYVHEVKVVEGAHAGVTFLFNLDFGQRLS